MDTRRTSRPRDGDGASAATWLKVALVAVAAVTILATVALWPRGEGPDIEMAPRTYHEATVVDSRQDVCPALEVGRPEQLNDCTVHSAELTSGPDRGEVIEVTVAATRTDIPELKVGDKIVLRESPLPDIPEPYRYEFEDYQRSLPLLWLGVAFAVAVVAFGRWQGIRALVGLGLSLLVLTMFIVPALLRDSPTLIVALVGATLVAYLAIYLAHGFGISSSIALAGTLVSLAITAALALLVASLTQLSGLTGEEAEVLRVTTDALDLRGLLVAGIVIGALGVLDDVTVSQVATVAALRRANPRLSGRRLYGEAIRVGRDHVAAAVNTLVLAYAGASLPLLMFFAQGNQPVVRLVTGELVAVEIVRMLVGSIGLILSVPITTGLAAVILARIDPAEADAHGHGHHHGPEPALAPPPNPPPPPQPEPAPARHLAPGRPAREHPAPDPGGPVKPWF